MPGFIGTTELILLGIVALMVFGPKRLPELGRSLGSGMREFRQSISGFHEPDAPVDVEKPRAASQPGTPA